MFSKFKKIIKIIFSYGVMQLWLMKEFVSEFHSVLVSKKLKNNVARPKTINEYKLKKSIMELSFWEKKILLMHYKNGVPLENIATQLSFDKNEVKKIYENTLFKLNLISG